MSRFPWATGLAIVGVSILAGAAGGAISGWYSAHWSVRPEISDLQQFLRDQLTAVRSQTTTTTPAIEIVPVTPPVPVSSYPDLFLTRNTSPVLRVVRLAGVVKNETGLIRPEQTVGSAVVLTTDGWLATVEAPLTGMRLADIAIVWHGRTYPVQRAVRDTATGAVFLKVALTGLPITNLARSSDVAPGTVAWIEADPQEIRPSMITSISARSTSTDSWVSELATRQFVLAEPVSTGSGGAVWSTRGDLIGLVIRSRGSETARVLPANNLIESFQRLLTQGEIYHATLGVRIADLSHLVFTDARQPAVMGALVMGPLTPTVGAKKPLPNNLQEGDVILRIERDTVDGTADLGEHLLDYRPGSVVTLSGLRKGLAFQVPVTLGSVTTSEALK